MTFESIAAEGFNFPWCVPGGKYTPRPTPKDLVTRSDWSVAKGMNKGIASDRMLRKVGGVEPPFPHIIAANAGSSLYSSAELDAWWVKSNEAIKLRQRESGKKCRKYPPKTA